MQPNGKPIPTNPIPQAKLSAPMIAFHRSAFHWWSHPWKPDPVYKFAGGFVGLPGQAYQVRFHLEAACMVEDLESGARTDMYLGAPCRTEYTIARENLFQVPSDEWRMAFSHRMSIPISKRPSTEASRLRSTPLEEQFRRHAIDIRHYGSSEPLTDARSVVDATINRDLLNGRIVYLEPERNVKVTLEFPVDLININEDDAEFQVCTGPVMLPDATTWEGNEVHRVFLADAAISGFDRAEFILRREIEAAEREKHWYEAPVGRDRLALNDPAHPPPDYPPRRPRPLVYSETWERKSENVILKTRNDG